MDFVISGFKKCEDISVHKRYKGDRMEKIYIVYASNSGNTEKMAEMIAKGVEEAGKEAVVMEAYDADANDLLAADVFALGSFASGSEEIDDGDMLPLVEEMEGKLSGKTVLLFGSHDWGDGEFIRTWAKQMESYGATILGGEGITCTLAPDSDAEDLLVSAGNALARL